MKKIYLSAVLLASTLSFTACDVNDLQPQTALSEETAFQTPERVELALVGVYDAAQSGIYSGNVVRGYPFGAAHIQQGEMRGEDMISIPQFYGLTYQNQYDPTTPNNGYMWRTLYMLINQSNIVLDGISKNEGLIGAQKAAEFKGEALFLRALAYHQLLINWSKPYADNPTAPEGGVFYRTMPINGASSLTSAMGEKRATVAECYAKMLEDLNQAEQFLPATRATNKLTRATKAAAIALKTRVYLHMGNWAKVKEEGDKLVDAAVKSPIGGHALLATPSGAFGAAASKANVESIFSIENNDVDNAGVNGSLPGMLGSSTSGARGIIAISPIIWNQSWWLQDDLRRKMIMEEKAGVNANGKFTNKYTDAVTRTDNTPIIRYAEVVLNLAEAEARLSGNTQRALNLLNAIRNRAVTDASKQYTAASFATGKDMVQAILNERRIELLAEGFRWSDIHRLAKDADFSTGGIPAKVNRAGVQLLPLYQDPTKLTGTAMQDAVPYADYRFLWPLPVEELINNPSAKQNPGY